MLSIRNVIILMDLTLLSWLLLPLLVSMNRDDKIISVWLTLLLIMESVVVFPVSKVPVFLVLVWQSLLKINGLLLCFGYRGCPDGETYACIHTHINPKKTEILERKCCLIFGSIHVSEGCRERWRLVGFFLFTCVEGVVFVSFLSTWISTAPFCAILWKEASANPERGSHQITTSSYRGPIFPRHPLPSAVSARPAELR